MTFPSTVSSCNAAVSEQWAIEADYVAIAWAKSWLLIAQKAMTDHQSIVVQYNSINGSDPLLAQQSICLPHSFKVLVNSGAEIRFVIMSLQNRRLLADIQAELDAIDLSCSNIENYVSKVLLCKDKL